MTPLEIESLFAGIGLKPILDAKPKFGKGAMRDAAAVPKDHRRRILRYLASPKWEAPADIAEIDYRPLLAQVSAGKLTPAQVAKLNAAVPDKELAYEIGHLADAAVAWANSAIPREPRDPLTEQVVDDPAPGELLDFRRQWGVACRPMSALDDLADGSLFDDQVAVLAQLYPATYEDIKLAVTESVGTMVARAGKDWRPTYTKRAVLGTLLGTSDIDHDLAAMMQGIYAAQLAQEMAATPPPPKRAAAGSSDSGQSQTTPGERAQGG